MKLAHIFIGVILVAIGLVVSVFVLSAAFQGGTPWTDLVLDLSERRKEAAVAGLGLILLLVAYVLTAIRMPERVQYLAYDIEGGTVSISLKAIQDFLARIRDEFASVSELQPNLKAVNGAIDVQLDVKVKSGAQIPELCRMLQDRARACIREKVGISDVREVRVRVQEIVVSTDSDGTTADVKPEAFA
jgi:uncharacterized alkaline shock family protein YloU